MYKLTGLLLMMITFSSLMSYSALKSEGKIHSQLSKLPQGGSELNLKVDSGFHFNIEAPAYILDQNQKIQPQRKLEKEIVFQTIKNYSSNAKAQFYVCDDAKTICEPHTLEISKLNLNHKNLDSSNLISKEESKLLPLKNKVTVSKIRELKFNYSDLESALIESKKSNKLLFIDFTASWCPPCLRLNHETFITEIFQSAVRPYISVKIDVDDDKNQKILENYSIKAFPTMVITDSQGYEIDRILDFLPPELLAEKLREISKSIPKNLKFLQNRALGGDVEAQLIMAQNAYKASQYKDCLVWYSKLNKKPLEYFFCQNGLAEEESVSIQINSLRESIKAFPSSFYSIDWRLELIGLLQKSKINDEVSRLAEDTLKLLKEWVSTPEMEKKVMLSNDVKELGSLTIPELHRALGDLYLLINKNEEAQKEYSFAIQKTMALNPTVENPTLIIYLVSYLKKAKSFDLAVDWLKKLIKSYPKDFTYYERLALTLFDQKKQIEALPIAQKAMELSYGVNKLKVGYLLAQINIGLNKKTEANALLVELLNSTSASFARSKHMVKKLNGLVAETK